MYIQSGGGKNGSVGLFWGFGWVQEQEDEEGICDDWSCTLRPSSTRNWDAPFCESCLISYAFLFQCGTCNYHVILSISVLYNIYVYALSSVSSLDCIGMPKNELLGKDVWSGRDRQKTFFFAC